MSHFNALGSRLFLFPRDAGQSVRISAVAAAQFISACDDCYDLRVRIPFTIGLHDAADIARVAMTMKCEHRFVFSRAYKIAGGAIFSSAVPLYYSCYCVWRASLGMDILNALWSEAVSFLSQGASVV